MIHDVLNTLILASSAKVSSLLRIPISNRRFHPGTTADQTQTGHRGQETHLPLRKENCIQERQSIVSITHPDSPYYGISPGRHLTSSFCFSWYKDGELLEFSQPNYITLKGDHITIVANAINEGMYTCIVKKKNKVLTNYSWRVRVQF